MMDNAAPERRQAEELTTTVGCGTGSICHTVRLVCHRPERGTKLDMGGYPPMALWFFCACLNKQKWSKMQTHGRSFGPGESSPGGIPPPTSEEASPEFVTPQMGEIERGDAWSAKWGWGIKRVIKKQGISPPLSGVRRKNVQPLKEKPLHTPHIVVVRGIRTRKLRFHVLHEKHLKQAWVAVRKHRPPRVPRLRVQAVQACAAAGVVQVTAGLTPCALGAFCEPDPPRWPLEPQANATRFG